MSFALRLYQERGLVAVSDLWRGGARSVLLISPTGCHAAGQGILMFDGTIKPVEEVSLGDYLVGPDGSPKAVVRLIRGNDLMYEISPVKGQPFVVNADHVLTLGETGTRPTKLVDVSVREWLGWSKSKKHIHKLVRTGVDLFLGSGSGLTIEPYFLGILIGDGSIIRGVGVSNPEPEIECEVLRQGAKYQLWVRRDSPESKMTHHLSPPDRSRRNPLKKELIDLGLFGKGSGEKFIPHPYKVALRQQRLELLAGLMDTDGSLSGNGFDYISKSEQLSNDVAFVCRSVGLAAYVTKCQKYCQTGGGGDYYRVSISGDTDIVPCRIARKHALPRKQVKDVLKTGFTVRPVGAGDYYGFTLAGDDGRYLLNDFTITHNSGKTVCAAHAIHRALLTDKTVLFIAHRRELVDQASGKLTALGIPHGIIMAGDKADYTAPVQVASVQTAIRRDLPFEPDLIITDEAHHASAGSYKQIYERFPKALQLGLTATPFRSDGRGLGDAFEKAVTLATVRELTDQGFLAPARYWAPKSIDLRGISTTKGDWDPEEVTERARKTHLVGDIVKHYQELAAGERAVYFAPTVAYSKEIAQAFIDAGVPAGHLDDSCGIRERTRILSDLVLGRIMVLVNVGILTEGWDSPQVTTCGLIRPTQSRGLFLQMAGRVLRPFSGKQFAKIIDHAGNIRRHGYVDDPIEADLRTGLRRKTDNVGPALRTCPDCFAVLPATTKVCPLCQHQFEGAPPRTIIQTDGTLEELCKPACKYCGGYDIEKRPHELHGTGIWCASCGRHLRWMGKQVSPKEFYKKQFELCIEKGWKVGRAAVLFKQRYGTWPGRDVTAEVSS